jgi:predicted dehydrogenase
MSGTQSGRTRLAIVGVGDVAYRHYLPPLAALAEAVEIAAFVDPRPGAAAAAAEAVAPWSPGAAARGDVAGLAGLAVDAAVNLTPAPLHGRLNAELLDAGYHLYSEKPLASSIPDADALIDAAGRKGRLFLCAPGTLTTPRFQWLRGLVTAGTYGTPTLVVAHHADPGPAAWREYTGDPTPFYREGVGPVFDHGVYRLHEMTMLQGPVRRVQAMGAISAPRRRVRGGPLTGHFIDVTTPDHVLINLEFEHGGLGQLLASFGTPETMAPWLEVHFPMATLSFGGKSWEPDAPVTLYLDDDGPAAGEAWHHVHAPVDEWGTVESGIRHFVACLRGEAQPLLTPEHARHVLDITLQAYASIADGDSHRTETTFELAPLPAAPPGDQPVAPARS